MRKFLAGLVLGFVLAFSFGAYAANEVRLFVDGKEVFSDVPPQIIEGRTMVPARPLAEALGAKVEWDGEQRAVVIASEVTPTRYAELQQELDVATKELQAAKAELAFTKQNLATALSQLQKAAQPPAPSSNLGPTTITMGDWATFKNYRVAVKEVRYAPNWGNFVADPERRFVIVTLAIETGHISTDPLLSPVLLVIKWKMQSGDAYGGDGMSPGDPGKLRPGQNRLLEHGRQVPLNDDLVSVMIRSPFNEDQSAEYVVTLR